MSRLALLAIIVLALASATMPPAQARSMSLSYKGGGGEVLSDCLPLSNNVGGACVAFTDGNVFNLEIKLVDASELEVGAYYEVKTETGTLISQGFFCGKVQLHSNYANPPVVKVWPSSVTGASRCDAPATFGQIVLTW